ncbi:hypothetical protein EDC04DRAFT_2592775 [Pisolithus marmoratus]|nr:hypothetical protein EDC04DRAFT_2592775 [Pisolithus marmoratus]
MTSTTDAAALHAEIARLTGAINRHKSGQQSHESALGPASYRRSNKYVNPTYKPPSSHSSQSYQNLASAHIPAPVTKSTQPSSTKDVVIDGVTFESSSRSLVRKDLPKPIAVPVKAPLRPMPQQESFRTTNGHRIPAGRAYKSKVSSRSHRLRNRNLTLDNTRPPQERRAARRLKYVDKPCPRFTTTGACSRGLTCMYRHDPDKIAICWNFLHGNCPNSAESCNLSHDPVPERTPLCVHFANNGRCTREKCPFPHVRVGQRHGVCRGFAVLGFCAKGLDCEMQHVRECPDFAEKGTCSTKGCKLPHVIRANRSRKVHTTSPATPTTVTPLSPALDSLADTAVTSTDTPSSITGPENTWSPQHVSVKDAQLGDDFVSLVFNESEDDDDDNEADDEDDSEDEASEKEGMGPTIY